MLAAALLLAAAYTATATPLSPRLTEPKTSLSKAFKLVINVTDISKDFKDSPVNGLQLGQVHIGAGLDAPIPTENGSDFSSGANETVQLAETGGVYPYAIDMSDQPEEGDPSLFDLGVNIGAGTEGFDISGRHMRCLALKAPRTGTFAVCDQGFDAYAHPKLVVKFVEGAQGDWWLAEHMPANCTAVRLLPQCVELPGLDGGTYEAVPVSRCYVGPVAAVDWSKYSACW